MTHKKVEYSLRSTVMLSNFCLQGAGLINTTQIILFQKLFPLLLWEVLFLKAGTMESISKLYYFSLKARSYCLAKKKKKHFMITKHQLNDLNSKWYKVLLHLPCSSSLKKLASASAEMFQNVFLYNIIYFWLGCSYLSGKKVGTKDQ